MNIEVRLSDGTVDLYVDSDEIDKQWEKEMDELYKQSYMIGKWRRDAMTFYFVDRHRYRIGDTGTLLILRERFRQSERRKSADNEPFDFELHETSKAALYRPAQWEAVRKTDKV